MEENLRSGKYCHRIREIGKERWGDYTVKYVLDPEVVPVITEVRIYRGKEGTAAIGEEYRSDYAGGKAIEPGSRINGRNRSHAEWGAELYP